jgi:ABC-2 type transport system permease protein
MRAPVLTTVLRSEIRRLFRSPLRVLAVVLYFAAGAAALQVGRSHVAVLESNLAEGAVRQERQQAEALAWFEEGRVGPEDRPWVDITTALWADWYAANHLGIEPVPLAAVSVGVSDVRSNLVRLSRLATPFDTDEWRQLANPERQALGVMDLAFVLTFFLPLLVIVLAFDLRGFERDRGIEGLLLLQSGRLEPWVRARLIAVAAIVGVPTVALWLLVGGATGAMEGQTVGWLLGGGLVAAYLAFWIAISGAVAVRAGSANRSAIILASVWICACVLVPALVNQTVSLAEPVGYSSRATDAARAERYELYEEPVEALLPHVYEEFPELADLPYAEAGEDRDPEADRHVYDLASHRAFRAAWEEVAEAERRRIRAADRWMVVNPVQAFHSGLTRLAGTEATAYLTFGEAILESVHAKIRRILTYAWAREPIDRDRFLAIAQGIPWRIQVSERPPPLAWVTLLVWTGLAFAGTRVRARGV